MERINRCEYCGYEVGATIGDVQEMEEHELFCQIKNPKKHPLRKLPTRDSMEAYLIGVFLALRDNDYELAKRTANKVMDDLGFGEVGK